MQRALAASPLAATTTNTRVSHPSCALQAPKARHSRAQRRQLVPPTSRRSLVAAAEAPGHTPAADTDVLELKMALLDSFWGTDRGLSASSDSRAEINELITQLEARNPTPEPNEVAAALGGTWRLAYTSNSELIALLALARIPLVSVGDITQSIDPLAQTVENRVELGAPLSKTALSATATFEVRSPKLLQISFEEGRVATPTLLADLQLPSSLELMGQQIDLAPLQAALQPVEGPLRSTLGMLSDLLSHVPDLRIPVKNVQASSWLLNTYLDDSLRITRGDGGSVFVLVRDASDDPYSSTGTAAAAAMYSSDWMAIEEKEPASTSAGGSGVGAAAVVAAPAENTTVVVVEPSAVIEEGDNASFKNGSLH